MARKPTPQPSAWLVRFRANAKVICSIVGLCVGASALLLIFKGNICQLLGSYCAPPPESPGKAQTTTKKSPARGAVEPERSNQLAAAPFSDMCPFTDSGKLNDFAHVFYKRYSFEEGCPAKFAFVHPAIIFSLLSGDKTLSENIFSNAKHNSCSGLSQSITQYGDPVKVSDHYRPDTFDRHNPIIIAYKPNDSLYKENSVLCGLDKLQFYMIQQAKSISYAGRSIELPKSYGLVHARLSKLLVMKDLYESDRNKYQYHISISLAEDMARTLGSADNGDVDKELSNYVLAVLRKLLDLVSLGRNREIDGRVGPPTEAVNPAINIKLPNISDVPQIEDPKANRPAAGSSQ